MHPAVNGGKWSVPEACVLASKMLFLEREQRLNGDWNDDSGDIERGISAAIHAGGPDGFAGERVATGRVVYLP